MALQSVLSAFALSLLAAIVGAGSQPVWFWFTTCGGPVMALEVQLDDAVISKTTVPLCHAPANSAHSQGDVGKMEFAFRPNRTILWSGYREADDKTRAGQLIGGSIWLAGHESDALILGVTFDSEHTILMHTHHMARPGKRDVSTIAVGLKVLTYPVTE